jgi:hypothetical protein
MAGVLPKIEEGEYGSEEDTNNQMNDDEEEEGEGNIN